MFIDTSALFEALLHVGTLGAVFVYFWKDIKMLVIEGLKLIRDIVLLIFRKKSWEDYPERRMVILIIVSSILSDSGALSDNSYFFEALSSSSIKSCRSAKVWYRTQA